MGEKTGITLRWPKDGVNRRYALDQQPPTTTPDADNVRPDGVIKGRERGGSRPGLVKAYPQGLGGVTVGTVSGTPSLSGGITTVLATTLALNIDSAAGPVFLLTTLTDSAALFVQNHVGSRMRFTASSNEYTILVFVSTTVVKVLGDATGENYAGGAGVTIGPYNSTMIGHTIVFDTTGNAYELFGVAGQASMTVLGDASSESGTFQVGNSPVRMLASVSRAISNGTTLWVDEFTFINSSALGSHWSQGTWSEVDGVPTVSPQFDSAIAAVDTDDLSVVREAFTPALDVATLYRISVAITPGNVAEDHIIRIYAGMNSSNPDPTADGFIITMTWKNSTTNWEVSIRQNIASSSNTITRTGPTESIRGGTLECVFSGDKKTVKVFWRGNVFSTRVFSSALGSSSGNAIGFGMEREATSTGRLYLRLLEVRYTAAVAVIESIRNQLVASANGKLYITNDEGNLDQLSATPRLDSRRQIMAAEHNQLLYIADVSDALASGTNGVLAATNKLTSATYDSPADPDWTELGLNTSDFIVTITGESGNTVAGMYQISGIAATGITLATRSGATAVGDSGGCTFRVERAVKIYDPNAGTLAIAQETAGLGFPQGNPLIARFQDRIFLAGELANPFRWYASAKAATVSSLSADAWDFTLNPGDPGNALAWKTGDVGAIGDGITALIPASTDYLILGTQSSLWVLRGDPGFGGSMDNLSRHIGIADKKAWCVTPEGAVVFLSSDGLYFIPPGINAVPQSLSRESLPQELVEVDSETHEIILEFDVPFRGVHVYAAPTGVHQFRQSWWFDWDLKSFWPATIPSNMEPRSIIAYSAPITHRRNVILGCNDGYLRSYSSLNTIDDDDTAITSHIVFGPIPLGGDDFHEGLVTELFSVLAEESGDVDWKLYVGDTMEDAASLAVAAASGTEFASGTWAGSDKLSYKSRPRARGGAFCLRLSNNTTTQAWAIEKIQVAMKRAGKLRK